MKKLRQWSQDSLANLSQFTNRNSNNNSNPKRASYDEHNLPTNGISTISSAIREQKIDPKKDNCGLYALKCDRSSSMANARRGILLNLPTTKVKTKAEISSFQSVEQNHEVFQSCERLDAATGVMYDGATSSASETKAKIEPPPRKKKRATATRAIVAHPKPLKRPPPLIKQANQGVVRTETVEKNDSGLYRIVNPGETARVITVDETTRKKEHVVTMVKPKVQKAVAVKAPTAAKPVQQQVAKVKSYEWNKHQRKSSVGNIAKPHFTKRYSATDCTGGSFKSQSSVDIFESNRLLDQKKLFDEFDALFDKNKESNDLSKSPAQAISKLNALKFSSSTFSIESEAEEKASSELVPATLTAPVAETQDLPVSSPPVVRATDVSSKPKIVSEQPKVVPGIIKKKIIYYDDKQELQQLIMSQTQSTTIINNHFNATVLPSTSEGRVPISCSPAAATGAGDFNGNDASEDYRRPKATDTTSSNSLRIFSNEGIFVFNL